jgi:photosystem II stability/assembly factor-like uncharacterized protein
VINLSATIIAESILLSILVPTYCFGQAGSSGCRNLSEQIWYDASPPPSGAHSAGIDRAYAEEGRTAIVATAGVVPYRSFDYGAHWALAKGEPARRTKLWSDVTQLDVNTLYQYESNGVITRSDDGGRTWVKLSPKIDGKSTEDTAFLISSEHDYVVEFEMTAVHPMKPHTIFATLTIGPRRKPGGDFRQRYFLQGMYISEDGGEHWTQFSGQVGIFDSYPNHVVLGINPWTPDIMFSNGEHGLLRSNDGGKTWRVVGESDLLNLEPLETDDRDEGILVPRKQVPLRATGFAFDPSSSQVVYLVSRKGVHRSLDGGDSWTLLNLGFDRLNAIHNIAVDPLQTNRIFAGTDRGLFMSDDRGCTFTKIPMPQ